MSGDGFVKLYESILGSSVWAESAETRIVFVTLLLLADYRTGRVESSVSGLARFANVTPTECRAALDILSGPDLDSKSVEWAGRRIERVEGGWDILNFKKYRDLRSPKQIADAHRQQEHRDRKRDVTVTSRDIAVDEDADVEVDSETDTAKASSSARADVVSLLDALPTVAMRTAWQAEIAVAEEGMHGRPMSAAQIAQACRDYVGNGHTAVDPSLRHFRAFLRDAAKPPSPDTPRSRSRPLRGAQTAPAPVYDPSANSAAERRLTRELGEEDS